MNRDTLSDRGYRFPPEIISHAVWLSHRVGVSVRAVEDLLAHRGLTVSYAATRLWCLTVGSVDARRLTRRQGRLGDIGPLDEGFVTLQGQRRSLWRAVDQAGDVLSIASSSRVATVGRRHACSARCCRGRRVRPGGWSPTRCAATGLRPERSCRPSPSARTDTSTIVPTSPTSPHGTARDTCAGSTLPGRHNDSCPCMDSSAPASAVAVTWCERCIIGNDEDALFSLGMPSRSPPDANCDHDPEYRRARRTLT